MKWKGIFLIIIVSIYVACNYNEDSLVQTAARWVPTTDNMGSSFSHNGDLIQNGIISVDFTLTQISDSSPWASLICYIGHDLQGLEGFTISYKSDENLTVSLHQADFGYSGNRTYSHYQAQLPSAAIWRSRTVYFNDFQQPEWTPDESKNIPYIAENVNAFHFSPNINPETGGTANVQIRYLQLF